MKFLFWIAAVSLAYTYLGYAGWLWIRLHWRRLPVHSSAITPSVSIVVVVRNAADKVEAKLRNLLSLDYPDHLLQIIVVSDGSSDATNEILSQYQSTRIEVILNQKAQGKAAGLSLAHSRANGELLVFTDIRQTIETCALRALVANFADSTVGCVSGELMLGTPQAGEDSTRMGLYWRLEKWIRQFESASGSVVGATGAFYAMRRSLWTPLPVGTVLDDVYLPMQVVHQGKRVVFESRARAWDVPDQGLKREFSRKLRTLGGNYQLLQRVPWLLTRENPLLLEFVSHKLLRLAAPFGLLILLLTSIFITDPQYRVALVLQLAFYGLSLAGAARIPFGFLSRLADASLTFVVLNLAALVAFFNFILGREVAWGN